MAHATIKKRSDFLRLRGGARCATPAFVLETKPRLPSQSEIQGPRFGYTVTKKIGGAVERNRIRRRLKAAVGLIASRSLKANHDYVLVARGHALSCPFDEIKKDLERALQRVHHPSAGGGRGR